MQALVRRRRSELFLLIALLLTSKLGNTQQDPGAYPPLEKTVGNLRLSRTSFEIAKVVCSENLPDSQSGTLPQSTRTCLFDLVERLGSISPQDRCLRHISDALLLRQEINDMILTASLQVDGYLAEIDSETSEIRAVHNSLTDNRDRLLNKSAWGSAIGTAGGAVGSALALGSETAVTAGSWIGATFGGFGAGFGIINLLEQKGSTACFPKTEFARLRGQLQPHCEKLDKHPQPSCPSYDPTQYDREKDLCATDDEKSPLKTCSPRMLYEVICPSQAAASENERVKAEKDAEKDPKKVENYHKAQDWWFHSGYGDAVKAYLQMRAAPHSGQCRADALIGSWADKTEQFPELQSDLQKEPWLFTGNSDPARVTIDWLDERVNKLADLRTVVSRMKRDLSRLTDDLARGLRCTVLASPTPGDSDPDQPKVACSIPGGQP